MFFQEDTASVFAEQLAGYKDSIQNNISRVDRFLKLTIVLAALNGRVTYQLADELVKSLGYREV